jgi:hypothetical protein
VWGGLDLAPHLPLPLSAAVTFKLTVPLNY